MTIVLDCGTTNTKLYLVQGKSCIRETVLPVGIRNIAGGMTKTQLKNRIRDGIEHLVAESGTDEQVEKLVAYGMITSELGFCELPHLDAPAGLAELQKGVCVQTDPELIRGVPVVYIRGLRNKVCPALPQETQLSQFDFMRGEETQTIVSAARELAAAYEENRCGMRLVQMNDLLQLCSAPEYADDIRRALEQRKPPRLSQPALEVLAIVAYFQPVTRAYIDQVRGVDSAYTVTTLLERGLIEACGRLDAPGRPSLYRTSALFLRTMGMQSLDELPVLPDLSSDERAEKLEQAISELRGRGEQMELTDTEQKPTGE